MSVGMKTQGDNPFISHSAMNLDELSCTTKVQRDKWWKAFWQYLDENPEAGKIVRRWQRAGCDARKLGVTIHRYMSNPTRLLEHRKERGKRVKRTLTAAVRALRDLETLYRACNQTAAADRIVKEANLVKELLSRRRLAFGTKRLGTSRSWTDLAMIEDFVLEATKVRPTSQEIVWLIRAGRYASHQQPDAWEINPTNLRKGLKNFKKNNPLQSRLWTTPSKPL
jgi:hypothetical protein